MKITGGRGKERKGRLKKERKSVPEEENKRKEEKPKQDIRMEV